MRWRRNGIGIKGLEGGEAGSNVIRDGLGREVLVFWELVFRTNRRGFTRVHRSIKSHTT